MTSTDEDVQSLLLSPEQLLAQVKELVNSVPDRGYPIRTGTSDETRRTFCTWECEPTEDSPYRGVVMIVAGAQLDMVARNEDSLWMRPNAVTLVHHCRGRETRLRFDVREIYPFGCSRRPPANMVRMIEALQLEDATVID